MRSPSGDFYESIYTGKNSKYSFYIPNDLCSTVYELEIDAQLNALLIQAHRELGILEGMTKHTATISCFEDMIICNDARYSCAVDGIITDYCGMLKDKKSNIVNYAINCYSAVKADCKVLTVGEICDLHEIVMCGMAEDTIGVFRDKQFLMHPNYTTNMLEYNPPPPQVLKELMDDLVEFIQKENTEDVLVKVALAYYQFETIHPFENGNGLVGRLIPIKILAQSGTLSKPLLSLSQYLFRNNGECLDYFRRVQFLGDYLEWIKFYIQGIIESTRKVIEQLEQAIQLRDTDQQRMNAIPKKAKQLLSIYEYVESNPIISIKECAENCQMSYNTATNVIAILVDLEILKLVNRKTRNKEFFFEKYAVIFTDNWL